MSKPIIEIRRATAYADHLRNYRIILDNVAIGEIADGETKKIEIEPGEHEIYLKIDWARSNKINIKASSNQTIAFECSNSLAFSKAYLAVFYAFFRSNKYLKLKQV